MLKKCVPALCLALLFAACSSDDGGPASPNNQAQIDALVGTWNLVELNVNPAQDVNEDGTSSENLLEELPCLTGTLVLSSTLDWDLNIVEPSIVSITEGDYAISCAPASITSGVWGLQNNQLQLLRGSQLTTYTINGTTLTLTRGENLPGISQFVFEKR